MTRGPWYISAAAVRAYLRLERRPVVSDGPEFDRAEQELLSIAAKLAAKPPTRLRNGLLSYRAGRPRRYQYIVSYEPRPEGPLPQLIDVWPASSSDLRRRA